MRLRKWSWILCLVVILTAGAACTNGGAETAAEPAASEAEVVEETPETTVAESPVAATDPATAGLPILAGTAVVEMQVNGGTIVVELDGDTAPVTAGNFVDLVDRGVYDGVVFHRVVKTPEPFVAQAGDPQSKDPSVSPNLYGTGGFIDPETNEQRYIPLEIQPEGADEPIYGRTFEEAGILEPPALSHQRGAIAMARSQLPNSASSQFYITLGDVTFLDGSYAVFGYVTDGMDVVDSIEQGDIVESATVTSGIENLQQPE